MTALFSKVNMNEYHDETTNSNYKSSSSLSKIIKINTLFNDVSIEFLFNLILKSFSKLSKFQFYKTF